MSDDVDFTTTAAPAPGRVPTLADRIRRDLAARARRVIEITHPDVPTWRVHYRVPADRSEFAPLYDKAERAEKRKIRFPLDAAMLAMFCEEIWFEEEQLTDQSGAPLTFRDPELLALLGDPAGQASDAVRLVYGSDGVVGAVLRTLMDEGGYGSDAESDSEGEPDPDARWLSGELAQHQHPLILFVTRYAALFDQDPVVVGRHPVTEEPLMRLYYAARGADLDAARPPQPNGE